MVFKKGSFKHLVDGLLGVAIPCCGEEVVYRPLKGGVFTIQAVFDSNFIEVDPTTEEIIASNIPRIGIKLNAIPFLPEQGDDVYIEQIQYQVTDSQEDGQGGTTLTLHKVI